MIQPPTQIVGGGGEIMTSPTAKARELSKTNRARSRFADKKIDDCGYVGEDWQWAEYKTSLLIQHLDSQSDINFDLLLFLQKIIFNIIILLRVDLHMELRKYKEELKRSTQGDDVNHYPVTQSKALIHNDNMADVWNNTFGLINFLFWLHYKLYNIKYSDIVKCDENAFNYHLLIELFQQKTFSVQSVIKPQRMNTNKDTITDNEKTTYVGISPFRRPELLRKLDQKIIEPWIHPGTSQCHVPYFGGYGNLIKSYRESNLMNDRFYGSLQCGPSGSVNYVFYSYLFSTVVADDKYPLENLKRLILVSAMQLAGDGGHNIREIMVGITSAIIILKHLIEDIKIELYQRYKKNTFKECVHNFMTDYTEWIATDSVLGKLRNLFTEKLNEKSEDCEQEAKDRPRFFFNLLVTLLNSLSNFEQSINIFYEYTSDINVVGIYKEDIQGVSKNVFTECKNEMYNIFFNIKEFKHNHGSMTDENLNIFNKISIFFALDNNRYLQQKDSFKQSADIKMNDVIRLYDDPHKHDNTMIESDEVSSTMMYEINETVQRLFSHCTNIRSQNYIPFA